MISNDRRRLDEYQRAIVVRNSPKVTGSVNRYQHANRQKKDDHCPACFQSRILAMSNEYFENLKQLVTDEVMSALIEEKIGAAKHI